MNKHHWLFLIPVLLLTACAEQAQPPKPEKPIPIAQTETPDVQNMNQAKKLAQQDGRVDEATAVILKDNLSMGLKVSNWDRLFLRDIRKTVFHRVRQTFPQYEIHVTTDSKLFEELKQLETELRKSPPLNPESGMKKLQKINDDMKG